MTVAQEEPRDLEALGRRLFEAAGNADHRRLVVLVGGREWAVEAALRMVGGRLAQCLWVSDHSPEEVVALPAAKAGRALGREFAATVFDAHAGFDPDAFGAVSGTVRGGGLMLLLAPPLDAWPEFADPEKERIAVTPVPAEQVTGRFLRRLVRQIRADPHRLIIAEGEPLPELGVSSARPAPAVPAEAPFRTGDQQRAVDALIKVVRGHRRRPVVLISDRGRGKSSAFGIAAARLLSDGVDRVVITAPYADAVEPVFELAQQMLPGSERHGSVLSHGGAQLLFVPPDQLLRDPRDAAAVFVDEAAAIPTPMLESLLRRHSRIAFASTVHGYEGTGRGFALRFRDVLDRLTPRWRRLTLTQPVRWAPDDPLEALVFKALALDAAAVPGSRLDGLEREDVVAERLDRDELERDEPLLRQVFGLLVLAHYRTRPYDLRYLLDGPNVGVHVLRRGGDVVATALVAEEGGLDAEVAEAVAAGRRRPRGHLIPESLASHLGLAEGARQRCLRVMRIVVHPAVQGRGHGRRLLEALADGGRERGFDLIGSSFGATTELLRFWGGAGFAPVRLGTQRSAASGTHSVMVLHPLSPAGSELVDQAHGYFGEQFPHQLGDSLRDLESDLVAEILGRLRRCEIELGDLDWRNVRAVAGQLRRYEDCPASLYRLALRSLMGTNLVAELDAVAREVLIGKLLQRRSWPVLARRTGLSGRAAVISALRAAVGEMLARDAG